MKTHVLAFVLFVFMIIAVIVNSAVIVRVSDRYRERTEAFVITDHPKEQQSDVEALYQEFLQVEKYISLTVSHEDLTNIEGSFSEWIGAVKADDKQTAEEMKNRLIDAFRHLGRLAKCNFDSIF